MIGFPLRFFRPFPVTGGAPVKIGFLISFEGFVTDNCPSLQVLGDLSLYQYELFVRCPSGIGTQTPWVLVTTFC